MFVVFRVDGGLDLVTEGEVFFFAKDDMVHQVDVEDGECCAECLRLLLVAFARHGIPGGVVMGEYDAGGQAVECGGADGLYVYRYGAFAADADKEAADGSACAVQEDGPALLPP